MSVLMSVYFGNFSLLSASLPHAFYQLCLNLCSVSHLVFVSKTKVTSYEYLIKLCSIGTKPLKCIKGKNLNSFIMWNEDAHIFLPKRAHRHNAKPPALCAARRGQPYDRKKSVMEAYLLCDTDILRAREWNITVLRFFPLSIMWFFFLIRL